MFKSILVPVDVTHKSSWQKAIPEAITMTKAARGKLMVAQPATSVRRYGFI